MTRTSEDVSQVGAKLERCGREDEPISWVARWDGCMEKTVDFLLHHDRRA